MTHYRIYLFGTDNHIFSVADVECDTDEAAKDAGKAMLRNGFAIEVWQAARYVCKLPLESKPMITSERHHTRA